MADPKLKAQPAPISPLGRQPGRRRAPRLVVQTPTALEAADEAPVNVEAEAPVVPNVDYLGRGWDVLYLDPRQLGKAPGQKNRMIFDISSTNTVLTPDARWRVPAGTFYSPGTDGSESSQATTLFSSWDFQDRFKEVATAEIGVPGLYTFSASATYESFRQQSASQESMSTFTQAQVDSLSLDLNLGPDGCGPDLQLMSGFQQFRDSVAALPSGDDPAYAAFIKTFGTHFSRGVVFGGRAYQTVQVLASTFTELTSEKIDLQVAAKGTFEGITAGGSSDTGSESQRKFDKATKDYQSAIVFSGGVPSTNFNNWFASVSSNPAPIRLDLVPLYELLSACWFPADPAIAKKKAAMKRAVDSYLQVNGRSSALTFVYASAFELAWEDKNSGGKHRGAFYNAASIPKGYSAVATYGQTDYKSPRGPLMLLREVGPPQASPRLKNPTGYTLVWADKGLGDKVIDGSFYRPAPPPGYVALSDWAVRGSGKVPSLSAMACVRQDVAAPGKLGEKIWDTHDTKAKTKAAIFRVIPADGNGLFAGGIWVSKGSPDTPTKVPQLWVPAKSAF